MGRRPRVMPGGFRPRGVVGAEHGYGPGDRRVPTWSIPTEADLISEPRAASGELLSLKDAINRAHTSNLELLVSELAVDADAEPIRQARAVLLPDVSIGISGGLIDPDRALTSAS